MPYADPDKRRAASRESRRRRLERDPTFREVERLRTRAYYEVNRELVLERAQAKAYARGEEERRLLNNGKSWSNIPVLRKLRREGWPKHGYRILCANCNTATMRGRTCPHQIADKEQQYA